MTTAVVFLIYGLSIGLHISAALHLGWGVFRGGYVAAHTHVILIGFGVLLLGGLGLWLLPKRSPSRWRWIPGACWWLLVLTVLGRSTGEMLSGYYGWRWIGPLVFLVSNAQALAVAVLGLHLLGRLRAHGAPR